MSAEREAEILKQLVSLKEMDSVRLFLELLTIRRKRHRDRLEKEESGEVRGRSLECRDLLQIFD